MTNVFITIDTELSAGLHRRGASLAENLDVSIHGRCAQGDFGVGYQARRLAETGLKAVFFVDPMGALGYGADFLKPLVASILDHGHEVQLHLHTEWLDAAEKPPVAPRGPNMACYEEPDQRRLIEYGSELLRAAGAPQPVAFRAGNYGADDRTLRALAHSGFLFETSFTPGFPGSPCRISLGRDDIQPVIHQGVLEVPVGCISDWPGHLRPAQLCALSAWEMRAGLRHAVATGQSAFTIVSHSFELIDRDRRRPNRNVVGRFEALCGELAALRGGAVTRGFHDVAPEALLSAAPPSRLPANPVRTALRICAQLTH